MQEDLTKYCKDVAIETTLIDIHSECRWWPCLLLLKISSRFIKYSSSDSKLCVKAFAHEWKSSTGRWWQTSGTRWKPPWCTLIFPGFPGFPGRLGTLVRLNLRFVYRSVTRRVPTAAVAVTICQYWGFGQTPSLEADPPEDKTTPSEVGPPLWTDRHYWKHYLPLRSVINSSQATEALSSTTDGIYDPPTSRTTYEPLNGSRDHTRHLTATSNTLQCIRNVLWMEIQGTWHFNSKGLLDVLGWDK